MRFRFALFPLILLCQQSSAMLAFRVDSWGVPDPSHCIAAMGDILGVRTPRQGQDAEHCEAQTWHRFTRRTLAFSLCQNDPQPSLITDLSVVLRSTLQYSPVLLPRLGGNGQ